MKLLSWCGPDQAKALIGNVCIRGPKGAQVAVVSLLARLCSGQPWWGEFLATTLVSLFSSRESYEFPATRLALCTFVCPLSPFLLHTKIKLNVSYFLNSWQFVL